MAQQILPTNTFTTAKWIVSATASDGTHTTIATALTSASSGDTIFIRPGTYTENLTLKAGVNLTAFGSDSSSNGTGVVIISGTCTFTAAGSVTISGIQLQTNSAALLAVTGSAASIVNLNNCYLNCTNNTGITFSSSNAAATINIVNCQGDLGTTGIGLYTGSSAGSLFIRFSKITNTGSSTTASSNSSGNVTWQNCISNIAVSTSSTGQVTIANSQADTSAINTTTLTTAGTGAATANSAYFASGSASAISVGTGTTLVVGLISVSSSNTNAVTGAGTLVNGGISLVGTSQVVNTTTQTAKNFDVGGISFDGGTNNLQIYSTGTFTATMAGTGTAGTFTYDATQIGIYTKVGNLVTVTFRAEWSSDGTATGNLQVINLPFTSQNTTNALWISAWTDGVSRALAPGTGLTPLLRLNANVTSMSLNTLNQTTGAVGAIAVTATGGVMFTMSYQTV